jgi:hypothetical protein
MNSKTLLMMSSTITMLASVGLFLSAYAQENITSATNETGAMIENQTNQTGGNQSQ